ncbi:MAG: IclR family transcriptional regulator [Desulfobacterales bacterium]|nr:IclR family transcriptional regulator [Desulfobacterales bacterium]
MTTNQPPKKLNAIEKALEIMLKFRATKPSWGTRELSAELGFSPATVQRILQTLKAYDFIRQDPQTRQYTIGNIFYRFLDTLNHTNTLTGTARHFMSSLAKETRETVHLNVIENQLRVCIDTIESPKVLKAVMPMGSQSPLYAGASAKCLLAFSSETFQNTYIENANLTPVTENTIADRNALVKELEQIRLQGYSVSLGERTPGLGSLSAPVFNFKGEILASLSLAIPEVRITRKAYMGSCIKSLVREANLFSKAMGQEPINENERI